jgi:hypothetical protein
MSTNHVIDHEPPPAHAGEWSPPVAGEHRSPCPALNSLANGGYLPRHGGAVTVDELVHALTARLGVPRSMAVLLSRFAMARLGTRGRDGVDRLDLEALCRHGFLEHDASLTRRDARHGDAAKLVPPLVAQLLSLSEDGRTLTLEDMAVAHQLRMAQSAAGGHVVPLKAGILGTLEAALLFLLVSREGTLAVAELRDFLENERFTRRRAPGALGWGVVIMTAARLAVMGNLPFTHAAVRAREAARKTIAAAAPGCPFAHDTAEKRAHV